MFLKCYIPYGEVPFCCIPPVYITLPVKHFCNLESNFYFITPICGFSLSFWFVNVDEKLA